MPIRAKETVLLICDIQDRFRGYFFHVQSSRAAAKLTAGTAIWNFDAVVSTSRKMIKAAKVSNKPGAKSRAPVRTPHLVPGRAVQWR